MAYHISAEELVIKEAGLVSQNLHEPIDYSTIKQEDSVSQEKKQCCYRQKASPSEHVVYFCSLAVASYAGILTRIYLMELVNWDGVPLFPSLYPQMVGTAIMGLVTRHKLLLANSFVYPAIATGLCGSMTAFSSWNSEAVSSLLQSGQVLPNNGVRILGWITTLLLGLGMSTGALTLGRHLATLSPWEDSKQQSQKRKSINHSSKSRLEGDIFVCVWLVSTVLIAALPIYIQYGRRDLVFSGVLATLGTYIRWHLSPLNSTFHNFKLGTFLANVAGAWLLGGVVCAQELFANGELLHDLLVGVSAGFCGSFAMELSGLPLRASYLYA